MDTGTPKILNAKKVMREAFAQDPDFKKTYIDNVAAYLHGHAFDMNRKLSRNRIASGLINLIFK